MIELLAQAVDTAAAAAPEASGGMTFEIGAVLAGVLTVLITTAAQLVLAILNARTSAANRRTIEQLKQTGNDTYDTAKMTAVMAESIKRTGERTEEKADTTHCVVQQKNEALEQRIEELKAALLSEQGRNKKEGS